MIRLIRRWPLAIPATAPAAITFSSEQAVERPAIYENCHAGDRQRIDCAVLQSRFLDLGLHTWIITLPGKAQCSAEGKFQYTVVEGDSVHFERRSVQGIGEVRPITTLGRDGFLFDRKQFCQGLSQR